MKVAILSGKGGTGKTLLSVNMAAHVDNSLYIDCDVEEPNGHLFFKPKDIVSQDICKMVPLVDEKLCNGCRRCIDFCKFNALAYAGGRIKVFEDICHACGGCTLVCPEDAILEKPIPIGRIEKGISNGISIVTGILNMGEPSGVPIITALLGQDWGVKKHTLIDCPPGSACTVMESIKDADYCILVAEPTIFGLHNLSMVYELVCLFNKPHGIVINKYLSMDNPVEKFCAEKNIRIIGRIPYDEELGRINSSGLIATWESTKYEDMFSHLWKRVLEEAQYETAINP